MPSFSFDYNFRRRVRQRRRRRKLDDDEGDAIGPAFPPSYSSREISSFDYCYTTSLARLLLFLERSEGRERETCSCFFAT